MTFIFIIVISILLLLLLGVILLHFLQKDSTKREGFLKSSQNFIESFESELLVLRNEGDITAHETLKNAFGKHYGAVTDFRKNLRGRELINFDNAWNIYCPESKITSLQKYQSTDNYDETKKRRLEALHNLKSVLKFAGYIPPKQ